MAENTISEFSIYVHDSVIKEIDNILVCKSLDLSNKEDIDRVLYLMKLEKETRDRQQIFGCWLTESGTQNMGWIQLMEVGNKLLFKGTLEDCIAYHKKYS